MLFLTSDNTFQVFYLTALYCFNLCILSVLTLETIDSRRVKYYNFKKLFLYLIVKFYTEF